MPALDRPLRVLVASDRYPPHAIGGYEVACHSVSERLRRRGHEVRVLTSTYGVGRPRIEGHVHRVLHRPQDGSDLLRLAVREALDLARIRAFRAWRPDVVYVWSFSQLFSSTHRAWRGLAPVVYNIQDLLLPAHLAESAERWQVWCGPTRPLRAAVKGLVRRLFVAWDRQAMRPLGADELDTGQLVFCSRYRQQQHIAAGLPVGRSTVIPNGIDRERFCGGVRASPGQPLRLLFVGRLVREKGVHVAVDAVADLVGRGRQVQLTVVGVPAWPFEYGEGLREAVAARGLEAHVCFRPPLPNAQTPELYRSHDVLLFTSIGPEGLPVTLLEAMACGLPVIATSTGGSPEIVRDGLDGLLVPPGDASALAAGVESLIDQPSLGPRLAAAALETVGARFDVEDVTRATEAWLSTVVALARAEAGPAGLP